MSFLQKFVLLQTLTFVAYGIQCPVEEKPGYTVKGKLTYPDYVYYTCDGCVGQETFGKQYCRINGSRDGEPLPNCTVSCLNSDLACPGTRTSICDLYPKTTWEKCPKACDTPALCHRESGETDCQCWKHAQNKLCETDDNIRLNVCPYTCSLRANITCSDPNGLFLNAEATLDTPARWMDSTQFVCKEGYINVGSGALMVCDINGRWLLHPGINAPHCVPIKVYRTFRFTVESSLKLEQVNAMTSTTDTDCARMCADDLTCVYFTFEKNVCLTYKYSTWISGTNLSNKPVWQKVLPNEYTRNFPVT